LVVPVLAPVIAAIADVVDVPSIRQSQDYVVLLEV